MPKKKQHTWVHLPEVERDEPATEITETAIVQFRNGMRKFMESKEIQKTICGTLAYRCMLDLDHLARVLTDRRNRSTITGMHISKHWHRSNAIKEAAEKLAGKTEVDFTRAYAFAAKQYPNLKEIA